MLDYRDWILFYFPTEYCCYWFYKSFSGWLTCLDSNCKLHHSQTTGSFSAHPSSLVWAQDLSNAEMPHRSIKDPGIIYNRTGIPFSNSSSLPFPEFPISFMSMCVCFMKPSSQDCRFSMRLWSPPLMVFVDGIVVFKTHLILCPCVFEGKGYMYECRCLWTPEKGVWSPEVEVSGSCESPEVDAGNWTWYSARPGSRVSQVPKLSLQPHRRPISNVFSF